MPKKTTALIIESGNDYVIAVKGNQPNLYNHIQRVAVTKKPKSSDIRNEKTRDRITTRKLEVFDDLNGINPEWKGIKSLIKVERTGMRAGKDYHEVVYYISSLFCQAKEFSLGIRGHWGIENRLHWVKDVIFNEDHSRIRTGNAPANLSIIKAIAINILRRNGHAFITTAQRFLSNDIDRILRLVEISPANNGRVNLPSKRVLNQLVLFLLPTEVRKAWRKNKI